VEVAQRGDRVEGFDQPVHGSSLNHAVKTA
jgi:hypothetical protein